MRALSWIVALSLGTLSFAAPLPPVVGKERSVQVNAGDNLYELGLVYGLAIEHFAFANRLPVQLSVATSRELTIPSRRILPTSPPADGLVVNLPERGVFLFRGGVFEKFYPVAIGQPGRFATPTGQFKLISLVKDPNWMPPEWAGLGKDTIVPAGPDNPLGDRWMGLSMPGLGLHSTTQPASIGAAESHGCMRMYPQMARELFDKLEVGYPVRIEYEPVKIGRDSETGSLCLAVFPDVYGLAPLEQRCQEVLSKSGISSWIEPQQLKRWLGQPQGVPLTFADGQIGLSYQGQEVAEPGLLLKSSQGLFLSVEALRRLGVAATYEATTKAVSLQRDQAAYEVSGAEGVNLEGKVYLPARATLSALGYSFRWDGAQKSLIVD